MAPSGKPFPGPKASFPKNWVEMRRSKGAKEKENDRNRQKEKKAEEEEKDFLNQFTGKEKIGEGTYGVVYRVGFSIPPFFPPFPYDLK